MKPSGIGGQAVIEGVMMKNGSKYAVAVRKPDKEIAVEIKEFTPASEKHAFLKLPIIRGVAAFAESLSLGMKTLTFSTSFYEEEEEKGESRLEKGLNRMTKGHADQVINGLTVLLSVLLAIGIFVVVPMLLAELLSKVISSDVLLALLEGVFRVAIFIVYIVLISQISDIKRMFMYHGAEHKSINCIENGYPLTVKNVKRQSKEHKRCGTSFMLNVMLISVILFMVIRTDNLLLRFGLRILLIPVIAGISYEFIRLAGRSNSRLVNLLSRPGLLMQALTTKEPDEEMIEVAIRSVEAVFDWQSFLEKNGRRSSKRHSAAGKNAAAAELSAAAEPSVTEKASVTAEAPAAAEKPAAEEKPLEIDISQLFDIKLPEPEKPAKRPARRPTANPAPAAEEKAGKAEESDDILKALDMYFEFDGPKTVMEITDEKPETKAARK